MNEAKKSWRDNPPKEEQENIADNENSEKKEQNETPYTKRGDSWDQLKISVNHALNDLKNAAHSLLVVARDSSKGWRTKLSTNTNSLISDVLADVSSESSALKNYFETKGNKVRDVFDLAVGDKIKVIYKDPEILKEIVGIIDDIDYKNNALKLTVKSTVNTKDSAVDGIDGIVTEILFDEDVRVRVLEKAEPKVSMEQ